MELRKPPALRRGEVIGLVAPSSPLRARHHLQSAVCYFEKQGFRVKVGRHAARRTGLLAGTDSQRVSDLHDMFRDPQVKAIVALRGGYGSARLLPLLDLGIIRRNPKILVGYSDLTALQLALLRHARLVSFSGPMAGVEFAKSPDPFTEQHFWEMITIAKPRVLLPSAGIPRLLRQNGGKAEGPLLPANLAMLVSLLGTRYWPDLRGALLALEETGEAPYRVDRMWTQLRLSGALARLAGVLVGQFSGCDWGKAIGHPRWLKANGPAGIPMVTRLAYGHESRKLTLPVGVRALLDANRGTLRTLEAALA